MTAFADPPQWATQLCVSFESGASGQFILHGNVQDRLAVGGRLVHIEHYVHDDLLANFDVVFLDDLGNGLRVSRGSENLSEWVPSAMRNLPHGPLEAIRFVSRYPVSYIH